MKILKGVVVIALFIAYSADLKAQKSKFLEGKKYTTQFYEIKPTGRGKAMPSDVYFKSGKLYADIMEEKIMYPPSVYNVELDSVYTEDGDEVRLIKATTTYTEDKDQYNVDLTITNHLTIILQQ
jgi:hypothetical protein